MELRLVEIREQGRRRWLVFEAVGPGIGQVLYPLKDRYHGQAVARLGEVFEVSGPGDMIGD